MYGKWKIGAFEQSVAPALPACWKLTVVERHKLLLRHNEATRYKPHASLRDGAQSFCVIAQILPRRCELGVLGEFQPMLRCGDPESYRDTLFSFNFGCVHDTAVQFNDCLARLITAIARLA